VIKKCRKQGRKEKRKKGILKEGSGRKKKNTDFFIF
jgi:hypothetical protein